MQRYIFFTCLNYDFFVFQKKPCILYQIISVTELNKKTIKYAKNNPAGIAISPYNQLVINNSTQKRTQK